MTLNDLLADRFIAHQVRVLRLGAGLSRIVNARLRNLTREIQELARSYVEAERLAAEHVLEMLRTRTFNAYVAAARDLRRQLDDFGHYEADATFQIIVRTIPERLGLRFTMPSPEQIVAAVVQPIQGATLDEWFAGMASATFERARRLVRIGRLEDQTVGKMVTQLRQAEDITTRHAEAVVRTLVNGTATGARQSVLTENAQLLSGVQWVSTLDSRTTPICQERDGEVFPVNSGPRPPAHVNCRSTIIPLVKGANAPSERAAAGGPVSADLTYGEWLKRQPREVQDEVLGKRRAELFRKGNLSLDRFISDDGRYYTLDEMRRREASAWSRAFGE